MLKLPIPPPLRGSEIGSWAYTTIAVRLPDIGRRILLENTLPPAIVARLEALIDDLPDGRIRQLINSAAPDAPDWSKYIAPYAGQSWLEAPWFFSETYFYRRILEALEYFEPGAACEAVDPFAYQKQLGLTTTLEATRALCTQVNEWLVQQGWSSDAFNRLLAVDLWGNQADLSLWPAGQEGTPTHVDAHTRQAHTLVDNTAAVFTYLDRRRHQVRRVDFMIDNAGFELVCDLCLADYLLSSETAATVQLNLKSHPFFVSDAMITDVTQAIAFLAADAFADVRAVAGRLQQYLARGRLQLQTHPYWTSPLSGWKMPDDLRQDLARAHLTVSKGDANYRRLLGDRHWAFTAPFAGVLAYFPTPLLALRTLKAELAAGLPPGLPEAVQRQDAAWLVNGRWGVIQFSNDSTIKG